MLNEIDSLLQKYQDFMTSDCSKYDRSMFKDIDNTFSMLDRDFRLLEKDDIAKLLKESVGFSYDVEPVIELLKINQAFDDINAMQKQFEDLTANLTGWDIIESVVSYANSQSAYGDEDICKLLSGCRYFFDVLNRISSYNRNDRIRYARTNVELIFKRMYPLKDNAWAHRIEAALVSISDSDKEKQKILSEIKVKSAYLKKQFMDVKDMLKNRSFGMLAARNLLKNFKGEALKLCEMIEQLEGQTKIVVLEKKIS